MDVYGKQFLQMHLEFSEESAQCLGFVIAEFFLEICFHVFRTLRILSNFVEEESCHLGGCKSKIILKSKNLYVFKWIKW